MNESGTVGRLLVGLAVTAMLGGCAASPTPSPKAWGPAVLVTGTERCTGGLGPLEYESDGIAWHSREGSAACTDEANDPRVIGKDTDSSYKADGWGSPVAGDTAVVEWGTGRTENAGGAWEGTFAGVYTGETGDMLVSWSTGTGGYAGLSYFGAIKVPVGRVESGAVFHGLIFPGSPPAPPTAQMPAPARASPASTPSPTMSPAPSPGGSGQPKAWGPAVLVTGTESCRVDAAPFTPDPDGVTSRSRGGTRSCTVQTDDPRVSGTITGTYDADGWGTELPTNGAIVNWGTLRLENAGGAWVGGYSGIYTSETGDLASVWFEGTGGYAGLSYFQFIDAPVGTVSSGYTFNGLIFPGSPPTP